MNARTSTLIAALAIGFGGAAFAQEATYEYPQATTSSVTRAAVLADLAQARADGTLQVSEANWPVLPVFVSQKSRAQVRGEAIVAAASGELQARTGEPQSFDGRTLPGKRGTVDVINVAAR
ncbi:MAG: DUF4148 domain-containing protein [Burkholderiales bacterium]|nr:DUF4148 domain-containing protein [Burkholderiales bacterium]